MLQTAEAGDALGLRIGAEEFTFADVPVGPMELARPDAEGRVFVTYPGAAPVGDFDAALRGTTAASDPEPITVTANTDSGVDAPVSALASGADLVLNGSGLSTVDRVFLWPDSGIRDPAEVLDLAPGATTANSVTVAGAAMTAAGLRAVPHRISLRLANGNYLPYVLLAVTA